MRTATTSPHASPPPHSLGDSPVGDQSNLPEVFRRVYYFLYSNSNARRAEHIMEDLSLILLAKFAIDSGTVGSLLGTQNGRSGDPNRALLPLLREAYPGLISSRDRLTISEAAFSSAAAELDRVNLRNAPAHILGEAFQALMGPRLRGDKGQFFTPRSLVRAMVEVLDPQPGESILDPACGTGGFLAEAHAHQARSSSKPRGSLVGIDKDHGLARLAGALLQIATHGRASVCEANSLSFDWQDPVAPDQARAFDVVLTNPPFGARIAVRDPDILSRFDLAHVWDQSESGGWSATKAIRPAQDPQVLFLELCVRRLKPGGRLGIVLPEGLFGNRDSQFIWHWLRTRGEITALLDCPRTTFQPGTDTKTNVLFFRRHASASSTAAPSTSTLVAVAVHCGHDRRGRTATADGTPLPDDFAPLGRAFRETGPGPRRWQTADLRTAQYMVPRYHVRVPSITDSERAVIDGATTVSLGHLVRKGVLEIRKGHEVGSEAYGTGDVPFVRTSDLSNFEIAADPTKSVSEEVYAEYGPLQDLRAGDILMVVDGRYRIGATALLDENNRRCIVQSHLRILRVVDRTALSPFELLFALHLRSVQTRIRNLVFVQSTLGTLGKRISELEIPKLHGPGPWSERVASFQSALESRSQALLQLRGMVSIDVEL